MEPILVQDFIDLGVLVKKPIAQLHNKIDAHEATLPVFLIAGDGNFSPFRIVFELDIYDSFTRQVPDIVDPPIHIVIDFTQEDLEKVDYILDSMKIGKLSKKGWVELNKIEQGYDLPPKIAPGGIEYLGYCEVEVRVWGDPPIALGT